MQITFLIGNGFDIGIGLKTRYEDFYEKYCSVIESDNDNIRNFKKMLQRRELEHEIIDWADFEIAFGNHSEDFKIEEKELYIERFEDFVSNFNTYLENEETAVEYTDEKAIAQKMETAITTCYYIRRKDKEEIEEIYKRFTDPQIYNFVSFNYTRSVDNCASILANSLKSDGKKRVGKIAHIHGYIDQNMIMGVNDASQITNPDFAKDIDVVSEISKPQQNLDARTEYENEVESIINNSHIICIYGMSIGATDKKWWNIISKWLAKSDLRTLVILKYEIRYDKRFPFTQRKIINRIVNNFLSYSDLPDNKKDDIKKRIYVGCNHNIFSMDLRKKDIIKPDGNTIEHIKLLEKKIDKKVSNEDALVLNVSSTTDIKK